MGLENSPSLKEFEHGLPPRLPDSSRGHRRARALIAVLSVCLAVLVVVNLFSHQMMVFSSGSGTITGMVLDDQGRPAVAEIIIERTDLLTRSDTSGRFAVERVPAGEHLLVVASEDVALEYPIIAVAGTQVDIGTVRVATTAVATP